MSIFLSKILIIFQFFNFKCLGFDTIPRASTFYGASEIGQVNIKNNLDGSFYTEKSPKILNKPKSPDCVDLLTPVALGIVQGVTEFLPISSTGHMLILDKFLKKDKQLESERDNAMKAYFAVIQCGSIFAILLLYRRRIYGMLLGFFGKNRDDRSLIGGLLLAFLPSAILGILLDGVIQNFMYNPFSIACMLICGAGLMIYAERAYKIRRKKINFEELSWRGCLKIGIWQCLALLPGMSRSMSTIVGGYFNDLKRQSAVEYSFLLGLVSLSAATIFKFLRGYRVIFSYFDPSTFFMGILVTIIFSMLSIKFCISYISSRGLMAFACYRVALGIFIFSVLVLGVI